MPDDDHVGTPGSPDITQRTSGLTLRVLAIAAGVGLAGLLMLWAFSDRDASQSPQLSSGAVADPQSASVAVSGGAEPANAGSDTEVRAVTIGHQGAGGRWVVIDSVGRLRQWDTVHQSFVGPTLATAGPGGLAVAEDGWLAFQQSGESFVVQDPEGIEVHSLRSDLTAGPVAAAAFHSRFQALVTLSATGVLRAWDLRSGAADTPPVRGLDVDLLRAVTDGLIVEAAALSADGSTLAVALSDQTIRIWRIERVAGELQLARSETAIAIQGSATALALDGAGRLAAYATGGEDDAASVCLVVISAGPPACGSELGGRGQVQSMALDRRGAELATGWSDGTFELANVTSQDQQTRGTESKLMVSLMR